MSGQPVDPTMEIELRYRPGKAAVSPSDERRGVYLGSGDGTIVGTGLRGTIEWDLHENAGPTACEMFFAGVIRTDDGARIAFETLGFGSVGDPTAERARWAVAAAVRFHASDPRHRWLTDRPMTWVGEFDATSYEHRYRVAPAARWAATPPWARLDHAASSE